MEQVAQRLPHDDRAGRLARAAQQLSVHGWIYDLHDGLLRDLGLSVTGADQIPPIYRLG